MKTKEINLKLEKVESDLLGSVISYALGGFMDEKYKNFFEKNKIFIDKLEKDFDKNKSIELSFNKNDYELFLQVIRYSLYNVDELEIQTITGFWWEEAQVLFKKLLLKINKETKIIRWAKEEDTLLNKILNLNIKEIFFLLKKFGVDMKKCPSYEDEKLYFAIGLMENVPYNKISEEIEVINVNKKREGKNND